MRRILPLSSDEVLIPLAPKLRYFLPERTNKLSIYHRSQIINATWSIARKKQNCLVKDNFSSKLGKTVVMSIKNFSGMVEASEVWMTFLVKSWCRFTSRYSAHGLVTHFRVTRQET